MAQPGEARAAAANARVGTIQKWIVGVGIGCLAVAFCAILIAGYQQHELQRANVWIFSGLGSLFMGFGWLTLYIGRGLLMYLRPRDVEGQLQRAAERTGRPRLYGLAMAWCAVLVVSAFWILSIHLYQASQSITIALQDDSAVYCAFFGLWAAAFVPLVTLESYGWWRRSRTRETPE